MDASSESLVKHIIKTFIMKIPSGITVSKFKKCFNLMKGQVCCNLLTSFNKSVKLKTGNKFVAFCGQTQHFANGLVDVN